MIRCLINCLQEKVLVFGQLRLLQLSSHSQDGIHGGTDLVAHVGEEQFFYLCRLLCCLPRVIQINLKFFLFRYVEMNTDRTNKITFVIISWSRTDQPPFQFAPLIFYSYFVHIRETFS